MPLEPKHQQIQILQFLHLSLKVSRASLILSLKWITAGLTKRFHRHQLPLKLLEGCPGKVVQDQDPLEVGPHQGYQIEFRHLHQMKKVSFSFTVCWASYHPSTHYLQNHLTLHTAFDFWLHMHYLELFFPSSLSRSTKTSQKKVKVSTVQGIKI